MQVGQVDAFLDEFGLCDLPCGRSFGCCHVDLRRSWQSEEKGSSWKEVMVEQDDDAWDPLLRTSTFVIPSPKKALSMRPLEVLRRCMSICHSRRRARGGEVPGSRAWA